jgi:hypothetical protein
MHISTDRQFLSTVDVCVFRIKLIILDKPPVSHRSWDSIVSIISTTWTSEESWFDLWQGEDAAVSPHSHLPQVPKLAMGPTHPVDCMWVKWPGHEVDHTHHLVLRLRMSGFVPRLAICLHAVHRDSFALTYLFVRPSV